MSKEKTKSKKEYITLEEFSKMCGKKETTIIKKYKEIPIIKKEKGEYKVLKGTRYPCYIKRYSIKDDYDKRYAVLSSISKQLYIDEKMLGVYSGTFKNYLKDLLVAGYIRANNNGNTYGANAYDCTAEGAEFIKKRKENIKKDFATTAATIAGTFVGEIVSSVYNQEGVA